MSNYLNIDMDTKTLARAFKALSNPNRLTIFQRLLSCCEPGTSCEVEQCMKMVVGELGKEIEVAPSTLSHHLKELHQSGLIEMQRKGQQVECWVNTDCIEQLRVFLKL